MFMELVPLMLSFLLDGKGASLAACRSSTDGTVKMGGWGTVL